MFHPRDSSDEANVQDVHQLLKGRPAGAAGAAGATATGWDQDLQSPAEDEDYTVLLANNEQQQQQQQHEVSSIGTNTYAAGATHPFLCCS